MAWRAWTGPSDKDRLRPVVAQLEVAWPQVLVNDTLVALRAGEDFKVWALDKPGELWYNMRSYKTNA